MLKIKLMLTQLSTVEVEVEAELGNIDFEKGSLIWKYLFQRVLVITMGNYMNSFYDMYCNDRKII